MNDIVMPVNGHRLGSVHSDITLDIKTLDIKVGKGIPRADHPLLADIVDGPWGWMLPVEQGIIAQRISSESPLIATYDVNDGDWIVKEKSLEQEKIPVVFLEIVIAKTGGKLEHVPRNYWALTNEGRWGAAPSDADTAILVDITNILSRRGKRNGKDEVGETVGFTKNYLEGLPHICTYSPYFGGVIGMHQRYGALDSGYTIPFARLPKKYHDRDNVQAIRGRVERYDQENRGNGKLVKTGFDYHQTEIAVVSERILNEMERNGERLPSIPKDNPPHHWFHTHPTIYRGFGQDFPIHKAA